MTSDGKDFTSQYDPHPGDDNSITSLEYASFWRRLAAFAIDLLIIPVLFIVLVFLTFVFEGFFVLSGVVPECDIAETVVIATPPIVASVGIALYLWLANSYGATLGKRVLRLHVISSVDHSEIGPMRGFIRFVVYLIGALPLCLGWLWLIWDSKHQALHDKAARSVVVHHQR